MPNKQIQSLTVEGVTYDIVDNTSGYINAQYIENKTDYSIPVSRVGEIVVGETAIGTDSTNFPTSKAVVDYVDERVVQEIDAIDVGVTSVNGKTGSITLSANDVGAASSSAIDDIWNEIDNIQDSDENVKQIYDSSSNVAIPVLLAATSNYQDEVSYTRKSLLTYNPSADMLYVNELQLGSYSNPGTLTLGSINLTTSSSQQEHSITLPNLSGTVALTSDIPEDKVFIATYNSTTYADTLAAYNANKLIFAVLNGGSGNGKLILPLTRYTGTTFQFEGQYLSGYTRKYFLTLQSSGWSISTNYGYPISQDKDIASGDRLIIRDSNASTSHLQTMKASTLAFGTDTTQYLANNGTWQSIPTVPTNISSFTNDSGYLTASDIASVMTYKGTKANYAALPASGNTTGDVWHLTDTGAEWAWDGSAWQELGTAIDLSNYLTTSDIAAWAKASTKPTYTAAEVGALPDSTVIPSKTSDLTNDSGFITSYTDEKVKAISISSTTTATYCPVIGTNTNDAETKLRSDKLNFTIYNASQCWLSIGKGGTSKGILRLYTTTSDGYTNLQSGATTYTNITFPNASGTVALTSDIPDTSSFLTSETDPIFSASAAAGITATDISNWNAKPSTDTNTTYTLSNTLASHKFTSTLTAGGSGSGTSTATMEFVAGTGITLTDDTTNKKITIASSVVNTDEQVKSEPTSNSTYYLIGVGNTGTNTGTVKKHSAISAFVGADSWENADARITLGNSTNYDTVGSKQGAIHLYSGGQYYTNIRAGAATGAGLTANRTVYFPDKGGTVALTSDIPTVPTRVSDLTNDSGFISSYTETDPVFSASAAAGITSTDISNWNAKVSDTGKWGDVSFSRTFLNSSTFYSPILSTSTSTQSNLVTVTADPTANAIAKYDGDKYLKSTTPSANDNSTKVATTAYVDAAIPKVYSSTNTGGYLTMATLPIYDGTVE